MTACAVRRGLVLIALLRLVVSVPAWGQGKPPAYDVVSIKPNKSGGNGVRIRGTSDRYSASGITLKGLVLSAYDLKVEEQIAGITGSMTDARFDIEAKVDEETLAALKKNSDDERQEQRRLMLQAMLADRFKLKVHHEKRELPIYALVVAKGGSKLKQADPKDTYPNGLKGPDGIAHPGSLWSRNGNLTGQGVPLASLTGFIGGQLHRMVEDRTGLTGNFDFTMDWTPEHPLGANPEDNGTGANTAPSIFTALQEQLGLKLDATKGLVDTIVVDSVEMPSEN